MKKGQIYEGTAEKIKFPNRGIVSDCRFVASNRDELQNSVRESDADKGIQTGAENTAGRSGVQTGKARNADECGEVIVKNIIPGQRVLFAIRKKRGGRAEGQLLEVQG